MIDLDAPLDFRATYFTFDFPGWQVTIDDQHIPITPADPNGLITFDVPAGRHRIEVAFTDTPLRTAANALSVVAVLGLAVVLVRARRGMNHPANPEKSAKADWLWLAVPVIFGLIKFTIEDRSATHAVETNAIAQRSTEPSNINSPRLRQSLALAGLCTFGPIDTRR